MLLQWTKDGYENIHLAQTHMRDIAALEIYLYLYPDSGNLDWLEVMCAEEADHVGTTWFQVYLLDRGGGAGQIRIGRRDSRMYMSWTC